MIKHRYSLATVALALAIHPASAAMIAGGIDPGTGLTTFGGWMLTIAGIAIPVICGFKGVHAVAEGRHLGPYIGSAIGGMVLAFGGSYILTHYGAA